MSSNGYEVLADPAQNLSRRIAVGNFGPRELSTLTKAASPQTKYASAGGYRIGEELGRSGLRHWGGFVFEEWLRELQQGRRAAEVYRDMMDSDAIIGSIMYLIQTLIRRVSWRVEPGDSSREAKQGADWYWGALNDMRYSWEDTLGEVICFLGYGYAYFEEVYKFRNGESRNPVRSSKFNDGTIGLAKLGLRAQDSLWKWVFDEDGEIEGMIQNPPPDYLLRFIPMEKALLFRTTIFKNNPEGRPLALDTPIRTPAGWSTMEMIQPGEHVFDETGAACLVTGKSQVFRDRPCYEIEFTTGHKIIADAAHQWHITTIGDRTQGTSRTMTTRELHARQNVTDSVRSDSTTGVMKKPSFCCGLAPVLDGGDVEVPLDPYILGYWLGDGSKSRAAFSCASGDRDHLVRELEAVGYAAKPTGQDGYHLTVRGGLVGHLREAGVLSDKHIPPVYLRASATQRLALLQGLMDSDGYAPAAHAKDQASTFANTNLRIIDGVCELVRSLGGQPRVRVAGRAGRAGGLVRGRVVTSTVDTHSVSFYLPFSVHRLERKRTRQQPRTTLKSRGHFIKAITEVESRDTVCIEVDSPSHLFLAGDGMVPTHNSVLRSAYKSWYMVKNFQNIEGIGVERDLAGLPVLKPPPEIDLWNPNDPSTAPMQTLAQNMVSSIRRDEQEGVILPSGWELELLTTAGARQFDVGAIINRYETRMAMTILADVVMLGQDKVGSYALAVTKKDMLAMSLGGHLDIIASQHNADQIPRLWRLNGFTWPQPKLVHGTVETIDLDTLGSYLQRLAQGGAPIDWSNVLEWAMQMAGAPAPSPGHDFTSRNPPRETISDAGPRDRLVAKSWEGG